MLHNSFLNEEVIELKLKFLAFSTDTVCQYVFNETPSLQKNAEKAENWQETIAAVGRVTPLIKQFPWALPAAKKLPVDLVGYFLPALGRLLRYHNVSSE